MEYNIPDIKQQLDGRPIDEISAEELKDKSFIVEISDYASKGLSVARIDGKVTFVPYVTPADIVEIRIKKIRSKYMMAEVVRIIHQAPQRIEPVCQIFTQCGGCWFQHVTYEEELKTKRKTVENSLKIIAHLQPDINEPIPSPSRKRYRNHIQIKSSIKRDLGFFKPEKIMVAPLPNNGCHIIPEEMNDFVLDLNENHKDKIIPHQNFRIRQNHNNEVFVNGIEGIDIPEFIYDKVGKYEYRIGFHNFFQVNRYQIENWLNTILNYIGDGHNTIVDLYCGVGLISLPLSERAEKVIGIEINRKAIHDANFSAEMNGVKNVEFLAKSADKGLAQVGEADVIVVDPPRAGCSRDVITDMVRLNPDKIVYVSCDPATFSRDCRLLADNGYELKQVQPIDMFPYTYHIEIVGLLEKTGQ
jgi:23S rRNA (uracil1939-C5)-methyltransferase